MRFREFKNFAKDLPAFNLNDVRKLDPDFHRQQLSDWLDRGYIQSLTGGYYLLGDAQVDESCLFMQTSPTWLQGQNQIWDFYTKNWE